MDFISTDNIVVCRQGLTKQLVCVLFFREQAVGTGNRQPHPPRIKPLIAL
jgi:hypothetical protein